LNDFESNKTKQKQNKNKTKTKQKQNKNKTKTKQKQNKNKIKTTKNIYKNSSVYIFILQWKMKNHASRL
jgi:hypothetical protein